MTVKRDGYGIPNVYADTTRALYSGYGYSVAEDRLFQMEMAKRSSVGTAAEALGPDYVEIDKTARNSIDPQSLKDQLARLPQDERDIFDGYAEGFNKRIDEVEADPSHLMPSSSWTAISGQSTGPGTTSRWSGCRPWPTGSPSRAVNSPTSRSSGACRRRTATRRAGNSSTS
ncbi:penicillin acylase family protein [Rhodococcus opacus]|nr:penicillin acylase family protein [Rhodococcus opacus]